MGKIGGVERTSDGNVSSCAGWRLQEDCKSVGGEGGAQAALVSAHER